MFKTRLDKFLAIILLLSGSLAYGAQENKNHLFYKAISKHNLEGVKQAIADGIDLNAQLGWPRYTYLIFAIDTLRWDASEGKAAFEEGVSIVKYLLENGAKVNIENSSKTPLSVAAQNGQIEAVIILLLAGADINYRNQHGKNAYELALERNHFGTAAVLQAWPEIKKFMKEEVAAQLDEAGILLSELNKIVAEYAVGSSEEESKENSEK